MVVNVPWKISALLVVISLSAMQFMHAATNSAERQVRPVPLLKEIYKNDFLVGVAVGPYVYKGEDKEIGRLVARQFNCLTPENAMKWSSVNPSPGVYTFEVADQLVKFANANGMKVAGHTLVWHQQTPDWVFKGRDGKDASRELLLERMKAHIQKVAGRYAGKLKGWDVVNEAVSDGGTNILRDSPWTKIIGDDFVVKAYEYAHQADPKAELYYNDYGLESESKREKTIRLIKSLMAKGVKIHAVGNQAHWHITNPPVAQIEKTIKEFIALGVKMNFTELDVDLYDGDEKGDFYKEGLPDKLLQQQAARYASLFALFRKYSKDIDRVTFWGPTDKYSWLNKFPEKRTNHPLLFDRAGLPKPAFWSVSDVSALILVPEVADHVKKNQTADHK